MKYLLTGVHRIKHHVAWLGWSACAVIFMSLLAYSLAHPVNLANADVGRHVANGARVAEWLFHGGSADFLWSNTYAYTAPHFAVPNHHWASGLLYYVIFSICGFTGLSLFSIVVVLCGVGCAALVAYRIAGFRAVLVVLPLLVPLFSYRDEVRPETFSFLFISLMALACMRLLRSRSAWVVGGVLALQLVWVNTHIYFFLGLAVIGAFMVDALVRMQWSQVRLFAGLLGAATVVLLCNPNGFWGVWYPATIFQNYGYRVLENQTIWFLWNYGIHTSAFWVFGVAVVAVVVAGGWALMRWREQVPVWAVCLAVGGVAMGLFAVRNLALAGALLWPFLSFAVAHTVRSLVRRGYGATPVWLIGLVVTSGLAFFALYPVEAQRVHALGLVPDARRVGEFLRQNAIQGPIFNNYDIGGLLIFERYPALRVFVDNRPEAYPASFFSDVYIPMQENAAVFQQVDAQYTFNAIVFNYRDLTPWAQTFLRRVVQDSQWIPVYVDGYAIVFVRDREPNTEVIARHALPRSLFGFTSTQ